MATHLSRLQRGLIVGAILGTAALPVPAQAHNPTYKGTIQYGHGGTSGGANGNTSLTLEALIRSGCTSTMFQGQETNGFDAAVISVADLVNHTLRLTWKDVAGGASDNLGKPGTWVNFYDAACAKKPLQKQPTNAHFLFDRTFVVPAGVKWLVLQPETGVTGIDWQVVAKDPPKPKPKPRRR